MKIPVLLITFNRLSYTKEVFAAIAEYKPEKLYIASDGPRKDNPDDLQKVEELRRYLLENITWECELKTRFLDVNSGGCALGVSGAITWFFENEEAGVILEDDCVPSQSFFTFSQAMLKRYKDDKEVMSITGYNPAEEITSQYDYEFASISHCWGWATWRDRWQQHFKLKFSKKEISLVKNFSKKPEIRQYWQNVFKSLNKIDSWFYPWNFCIAQNKGLTIYPVKNLISNIGEIGVHYSQDSIKDTLCKKTYELTLNKPEPTRETEHMNDIIWRYFLNINKDNASSKTVFYLFNFLPVYKIKKKKLSSRHYLFGIIPILKIKTK